MCRKKTKQQKPKQTKPNPTQPKKHKDLYIRFAVIVIPVFFGSVPILLLVLVFGDGVGNTNRCGAEKNTVEQSCTMDVLQLPAMR